MCKLYYNTMMIGENDIYLLILFLDLLMVNRFMNLLFVFYYCYYKQ